MLNVLKNMSWKLATALAMGPLVSSTGMRFRRRKTTKSLAKGFPGAGVQFFVPRSDVNMQFMVKDSKKFAATGGWGFGDFTNGKPGNEKLMKTCFACHQPAKDHDFIFTRYAP